MCSTVQCTVDYKDFDYYLENHAPVQDADAQFDYKTHL